MSPSHYRRNYLYGKLGRGALLSDRLRSQAHYIPCSACLVLQVNESNPDVPRVDPLNRKGS